MSRYLIVCPEFPSGEGAQAAEDASPYRDATGLARGLVAAGHAVLVLTSAPARVAARVPGLARRLRKLEFDFRGARNQTALFEGRFSAAEPQLVVLERPDTADAAVDPEWLGAALGVLASDALLQADAAVAWGEAAAPALAAANVAVKLFVLPHGRVDDAQLARTGATAAQAILVPGASAARALDSHPALADRAADEPIVAFCIGSDGPLLDPAVDPALPASYSAAEPAGKAQCRRALARRLGLVLGPRTLLLGWHPEGGASFTPDGWLNLLRARLGEDLAVVIAEPRPGETTGCSPERVRALAIEHPTRLGLLPATDANDGATEPSSLRLLLASCDALWLDGPRAARRAGLALRYGTLPVLPESAAAAAGLVDLDVPSRSGNAAVVRGTTTADLERALVRALALRAESAAHGPGGAWADLRASLFASTPTWRRAAEVFDRLRERAEAGRDERLAL